MFLRRNRRAFDGETYDCWTLRRRQGRFCEVPAPASSRPQWAQVDVHGVREERVRDFGQVYLALSLWRRLGLHTLLGELIAPARSRCVGVDGSILTVTRFCGQKSEQSWKWPSAGMLTARSKTLPVRKGPSGETCALRLRLVARPDRPVAELLHHLGLELPSAPKIVQNVVEKNAL